MALNTRHGGGRLMTSDQLNEGVKRTKDPVWKDSSADVTLVSSDMVEFKVHSYYLRVAR